MKRTKVLAVAVGVSVLVVTLAYAGVGAVEQAVMHVGAAGMLVLALLRLPIIATAGLAWFAIGAGLSGASPGKFLWARYVREATAEVLPFSELGGIVASARVLKLTGVSSMSTGTTLFADVLIEQIAKLPYVLAGTALLVFGAWNVPPRLIVVAVLPVSILTLVVLGGHTWALPALERLSAMTARRCAPLRRAVTLVQRALLERAFGWNRRTATAFACHLLGWALGALETWITCALMGLSVSPERAVIIDSLFCGIRTLGFAIPAALGAQEAGYVLVCALVGVAPAPAVALSLVRRVRELLVGVPALGVWQIWEGGRALTELSDR